MPSSLQERADELGWYHTIELGDGVVTKGYVDTRGVVARVPLPSSLAGKRCLDVGTQNGFWAFHLERLGAAAVTGIDLADSSQLDWPPRQALADPTGAYLALDDRDLHRRSFEFAKNALGSKVEWMGLSVYDLSREQLGTFDFVFMGSLLLHLRDPVRALARVREVCAGEAVFFDGVSLVGSVAFRRRPWARIDGTRVWWWTPNRAALYRMIDSAGWEIVEHTPILYVPIGSRFINLKARDVLRAGVDGVVSVLKGAPHIAVRARPLGTGAGVAPRMSRATIA
jgi:tRNA (mo5U34)-methyltransferase